MSVSCTVYQIFSVKETGGRGHSRSLKMAPFDRPYTTYYRSTGTNIRSSILYHFWVV